MIDMTNDSRERSIDRQIDNAKSLYLHCLIDKIIERQTHTYMHRWMDRYEVI